MRWPRCRVYQNLVPLHAGDQTTRFQLFRSSRTLRPQGNTKKYAYKTCFFNSCCVFSEMCCWRQLTLTNEINSKTCMTVKTRPRERQAQTILALLACNTVVFFNFSREARERNKALTREARSAHGELYCYNRKVVN